jgi:hypothetical protein
VPARVDRDRYGMPSDAQHGEFLGSHDRDAISIYAPRERASTRRARVGLAGGAHESNSNTAYALQPRISRTPPGLPISGCRQTTNG